MNKELSKWMVIGAGLGIVIGILTNKLAIGLAVGAGIGVLIGFIIKKNRQG